MKTPVPRTGLTIPPDLLPADGRFGCGPSKVRPEQIDAVVAAATIVDRHVASSSAREGTGRRDPPWSRRAVQPADGLGDRPRQRRHDRVLGRRHVRSRRAAQPAPRVRRVLRQVRRRLRRRSAPRRPDGDHLGARRPPRRRGRRRRRRVRADAQRDVHRRGDAAAPPRRGDRTTSSSSSTPRRRPAGCRGTWTTSTCTTSPRRSASPPTADCGSPPVRRRRSSASTASPHPGRWRPASLDLVIARDNSRLDQTYNTPAVATLVLLADQLTWMLELGGLAACAKRSAASAEHLYGWAEATDMDDPLRRRPRPSARVSSPRSTSTPASTPQSSPPPCGSTASSTPTDTASSDATRSASACSRPSRRSDVVALTACIDHLVNEHGAQLAP